jgi:hypothetical protein
MTRADSSDSPENGRRGKTRAVRNPLTQFTAPPLQLPSLSWRTAVAAFGVYGLTLWFCSWLQLRGPAEWAVVVLAVTTVALGQIVMFHGRQSTKAAFLMGGVLISLAVAATVLGGARGRESVLMPALFLLPVLFVGGGLLGLVVGFATAAAVRWIHDLPNVAVLPDMPPSLATQAFQTPAARRWTIRVMGAMLAAVFGLTYWVTLAGALGEHVTASECPYRLPPEATDVCYFRAPFWPWGACEFNVAEAPFLAWVQSTEKQLKPIGQEPIVVRRYCAEMPNTLEPKEARIAQGWFGVWTEGKTTTTLGYDRAAGRAFYCFVTEDSGEESKAETNAEPKTEPNAEPKAETK